MNLRKLVFIGASMGLLISCNPGSDNSIEYVGGTRAFVLHKKTDSFEMKFKLKNELNSEQQLGNIGFTSLVLHDAKVDSNVNSINGKDVTVYFTCTASNITDNPTISMNVTLPVYKKNGPTICKTEVKGVMVTWDSF